MPYCSILQCKNVSHKQNICNGGITYHRYPKDPYLKEKWINATGRQNWFPRNTSTVCSVHFKDEDFIVKKSGKTYLIATAVPVQNVYIFKNTNTLESQNNPGTSADTISFKSNRKRKLHFDITTQTSSQPEQVETHNKSTPRKQNVYSLLQQQQITIDTQNLLIRKLRARNRRLKIKLLNLKIE